MLKGKECVWWEETIGKTMIVEYKSKKYILEFLNYKTRYITIKVNDNIKEFCINVFYCRGNIANLLKNHEEEILWKYNIGDVIDYKNKKYEIEEREIRLKLKDGYKSYEKWYRTKCLKCGYEKSWRREDTPFGCVCCNGKVVITGYNDLATTRPDIIKYLKNKDDAYKYTSGSHTVVQTICPICGHEKEYNLGRLCDYKFSCNYCSDGISYPEKFMIELLNQNNIKYIYQYRRKHAEWCKNYLYDFYIDIDGKSYIIEIHGMQHYRETNITHISEVRQNDLAKMKNALGHIDCYVVIDARYSDLDFIKRSILNSEIGKFIDNDKTNWKKCDVAGCKSISKDILKLWNYGCSIGVISDKIGIGKDTVAKYLRKICPDYNTKLSEERTKECKREICRYEWMTEELSNFERMERKYTQFQD